MSAVVNPARFNRRNYPEVFWFGSVGRASRICTDHLDANPLDGIQKIL